VKETIAEMLKVEAEAKAIVARAVEEAEEIVRKARTEAVALQDAAERAAQAEAARLIEDGGRQARSRRSETLAEVDQRAQRLRLVPQESIQAAKALVLAALAGR